MKKILKYILFIIIIIVSLIGIKLYIDKEETKQEYSENPVIQEAIESIVNEEIDFVTQEELDEIEKNVQEILDTTSNQMELAKGNYILGYIDYINIRYEEAIGKYEEAISYTNINTLFKAGIHFNISKAYARLEEYEKSKEEFQKTIDLCRSENLTSDIVDFYLSRSVVIYNMPNGLVESIELVHEALELAKEIDYEELEMVYVELGTKYWYDNKVIEATNYKLEGMKIAEAKGKDEIVRFISTDLGIDFLFMGNYSESIRYLEMSLNYTSKDPYDDADARTYSLLNLCDAYVKIKQYDKAKEYFVMLEDTIELMMDGKSKEDTRTFMYLYRAELETRTGNPNLALEYLDLAKSRYEKREDFLFYNCDIELAIKYGNAYYALGEYEKSLEYHKEAESLTDSIQANYLQVTNNENLYLDYKALNDTENTIKYLEKNNQLKLELIYSQDSQYSQYLVNKFDDDKNKEKISQLQISQNIMRTSIIALGFISAVILVLFTFIVQKNKEIKRLNTLFKDLSITDGLTCIPNRRAMDEYLLENWDRIINEKIDVSIIMIDIDYFKRFNDNYGHIEGDKVLGKVAECIKDTVSNEESFVARYGGEEFIIINENYTKEKTIDIAERIQKNIYELNITHKDSLISDRITLSMGITIKDKNDDSFYKDIICKADKLLYTAKDNGRNRYEFIE